MTSNEPAERPCSSGDAPVIRPGSSAAFAAEDAGSPADPAPQARRQSSFMGRRLLPAISACVLLATGLAAAFAWSELHPAALDLADAAYQRNDLESALRITQSHLARRPDNRHATLLAARCLSRLGRPKEAEALLSECLAARLRGQPHPRLCMGPEQLSRYGDPDVSRAAGPLARG